MTVVILIHIDTVNSNTATAQYYSRIFIMQKRPRVLSSPTFTTPVRAQKRIPLQEIVEEEIGENVDARREITSRLTYECDESSDESRGTNWSNAELKGLFCFMEAEFIGLLTIEWITASFIKMRSNTSKQRSSNYYIHTDLGVL